MTAVRILRTATLLMNRDHKFDEAEALLTAVLDRRTRGSLGVRRLRALAAARGGHAVLARQDAEYLRNRPGGEDTFHRIEAEIALTDRHYEQAREHLRSVRAETAQDRLFYARIAEAEARDHKTPLSKREHLNAQAAMIRANVGAVDEYDFER